ncbi:MAG TPA: TlpA disulfide reductase family protein [Rhodanobacteraceae bacterium]
MQAVTIGPWVFGIGLVALVLGWIAANVAAWFSKRRTQVDAGTPLWVLLLAALIAARAAFVLRGWHAYAAAPLSMLDIRDGGFAWPAGVVVLLAGALLWMWRRPRLRQPLSISVGAGLAIWAVVAFGAPQLGARSAYPPLPVAALQQMDGQPVSASAFAGKPLVVNLWATWCAPCRSEMPMLVAASRELPGVRFVFVDHGEAAATVEQYFAHAKLYPQHILLDRHGTLMRDYQLPGCPATLFVDAAGKVRSVHLGVLSTAALRIEVQHLRAASGAVVMR